MRTVGPQEGYRSLWTVGRENPIAHANGDPELHGVVDKPDPALVIARRDATRVTLTVLDPRDRTGHGTATGGPPCTW